MSRELVTIRPEELKFPFELKKQVSCSLQLVNPTDHYVAFKVKTTSPKKYCVRPNTGIILPKTSCDVAVTMQAQKEAPPDLQCKDKFLVQSVMVPFGTTLKDITPDTFSKEAGKIVEESKLRVVYVSPPPEPPSPVPELSEEGSSPKASVLDNTDQNGSPFELAPVDLTDLKTKLSEAQMAISRLTEERNANFEQRQQLQQELALLKKRGSAKVQVGFSFLFVCVIGLLGILIGYLFHS